MRWCLNYLFTLFVVFCAIPICLGVNLKELKKKDHQSLNYKGSNVVCRNARYALLLKIAKISKQDIPDEATHLTLENALTVVAEQILNKHGNSFKRGFMFQSVKRGRTGEFIKYDLFIDERHYALYIVNYKSGMVHQLNVKKVTGPAVASDTCSKATNPILTSFLDSEITHPNAAQADSKDVKAMSYGQYFVNILKTPSLNLDRYMESDP